MENEKKKTGYQSTWQDQLKETANKIINREKFSYDLNGDALYKQYKDRYTQQGKQAMMDTMGQAQTMTGGYGNSYAQSVGQQTYQGYMQGLNDQIPALYQIALDKYTAEGNQMRDNMNLMMQQDSLDYGRYRDMVGDQQWQDSFDYGKQRDEIADQQWRENFEYQQNRDKVNDQQWQDSFDYGKQRDEIADQQWRENFEYGSYRDKLADQDAYYSKLMALMTGYGYKPTAEEMAAAGMTEAQYNAIMGLNAPAVSTGGGSSGSPSNSGSKYDKDRVLYVQQELNKMGWNLKEDGIFGEETRAAYAEYNKLRNQLKNNPGVLPAPLLFGK